MLILRTLARGPLHGYAIARRMQDLSASGLQIEYGSLYLALNHAAEWGISDTNHKAVFFD
jgi:PadR family transcriptional regulator PadR